MNRREATLRRETGPHTPCQPVLPLELGVPRWDNTNEHERFLTGVLDLMLLVGRYENRRPG